MELLGSTTSKKGANFDAQNVYTVLSRFHQVLFSFVSPQPSRKPLSPSLINYIFFPLAQLLRNSPSGEAKLPDRIRQLVFQILSCLASDWWQLWIDSMTSFSEESASKIKEQWKVWEQLLILGAVAVAGPPDGKSPKPQIISEETHLAALSFLQELLLPRIVFPSTSSTPAAKEWEWDGEEELPSLDDYESQEEASNGKLPKYSQKDETRGIEQVYPCSSHLDHVYESTACRGAIAHALTATLEVACDPNSQSSIKVACLKVARILISYWLVGDVPDLNLPSALYKEVKMERLVHGRGKEMAPSEAQADRLAVFLPGYVSSMVRILGMKSNRNSSQVISQALLSLAPILEVCLCNEINESISTALHQDGLDGKASKAQAASIEELVARAQIEDQLDESTTDRIEVSSLEDKSTGRNKKWLESTVSHVVIALYSIDPLASYDHSQVQIAIINLAYILLSRCSLVLKMQKVALSKENEVTKEDIDATRLLLRWIVDVSANENSTEIATTRANKDLCLLLCSGNKHVDFYKEAVFEELRALIQSLSSLFASQKDEDIERRAKRLSFLLRLSTCGFDESIDFIDKVKILLQAANGIEMWGSTLLWSLVIDDGNSVREDVRSIKLQGLSMSTSKAVMDVFDQFGRARARLVQQECRQGKETTSGFALLWYFMDQAALNRSTRMTTSTAVRRSRLLSQNALVIVDQMARGVAHIFDDERLAKQTSKDAKRLRKVAHRFAKEMITRVSDLWEEDEDELLHQDLSIRQENLASSERELITRDYHEEEVVEHQRGITEQRDELFARPAGFGPALKLDFISPAMVSSSGSIQTKPKSNLQLQSVAKNQLDRSDALLLSILTSSSKILGHSLKPLLLEMLYPIICGVASQSPTIREAAMQAMDEMAHSAGYASIQGCVSDHADYVLGTASHRLVSTLGQELQAIANRDNNVEMTHVPLVSAQSAPLVLVEIIRMLGGEALTLVQDAIDEVLDAIDRYHLQEALCDDLLNVLVRLVEVMVNEERSKTGQDKKSSSPRKADVATIAFHPDIDQDMKELHKWWKKRYGSRMGQEEQVDKSIGKVQEKEEDQGEAPKPSASQIVVVSILEKAVPFLSHSSAMIRIRCLRLLNWGVELLCLQERTIEPLQIISKAWPAVMSRLGFSLSLSLQRYDKVDVPSYDDLSERDFVACTEAAKLVTTLAKYLINYLGNEKMLRQAVPRLLLLLKMVARADGRSHKGKQGSQKTFLLKEDTNSSSPHNISAKHFQPLQKFTTLHTMTDTVMATLDTIVTAMGPQISEDDLYRYSTHPILLSCLDRRQEEGIQNRAQHFYRSTLSKRNENLVWYVLSAAKDKQDKFPRFLQHPELDLVDW